MSSSLRFIDIGSNLGDPTFRGKPRSRQIHPDDLENVMARAKKAGVVQQILTGDNMSGSKEIIELAHQYKLKTTAGLHPCRATEAKSHPGGPSAFFKELDELLAQHKGETIVAVGECGLDYDRLFLSDKASQLAAFPPHLELATKHDLPLFLHSRTSEAHKDLVGMLKQHTGKLRGVVHSHTGSLEEAMEYIEMGYYIGINGCSLKTEENCQVVKALPLDKLMLETDCPWCEIRPSHSSHKLLSPLLNLPKFEHLKALYAPPQVKAEKHRPDAMVKSRNEPCTIGQVAWCISALKQVPIEEVAEAAYKNTAACFGL